jgi:hypothetical protein
VGLTPYRAASRNSSSAPTFLVPFSISYIAARRTPKARAA